MRCLIHTVPKEKLLKKLVASTLVLWSPCAFHKTLLNLWCEVLCWLLLCWVKGLQSRVSQKLLSSQMCQHNCTCSQFLVPFY